MLQPVQQYQLVFEGSWPSAVTFLDSSRRVAAANQDGEIFVWNLPEAPPEAPESGKTDGTKKPEAPNVPPAWRLDGHTNAVSRLLYDNRRKLLVSSPFNEKLKDTLSVRKLHR